MNPTHDPKGSHLVARYDRLIAALECETYYETTEKGCGQAQNVSVAIAKAVEDDTGHELLTVATDKSVRCAELIAKSLEASKTVSKLHKTLKMSYGQCQENESEEDETMDGEEDAQEEEATTLLLQDLVAAGNEADDAAQRYARLGVVQKTKCASQKLLASAESHLTEYLANESATVEDVTSQNEFRQLYMEEFTSCFGNDLDQFRQEERFESKDVSYLISCIHAGGDIFSPLQKKLFVESVGASQAME